jgi:hypothetical protein
MPKPPPTTPVGDDVPKVGDVAVGENLEFQRKWWIFERVIWLVFLLVIACDLVGLFGQGWLAQAKMATPDGGLSIDYERVERASTPSTMVLKFGPAAFRDGKVQVYVSDVVVKELGAQRISPEPATSTLGDKGITYVFPATRSPAQAQIQLQPSTIGTHSFSVEMPGEPPLQASVFVLP